jgi:probable O-glycosylation ligase (exosortase A-associated)
MPLTDVALVLIFFFGFTNASDVLGTFHSVPGTGQLLFVFGAAVLAIRAVGRFRERVEPRSSPAARLLPVVVALVVLQLASSWWASDPAAAVTEAGLTLREGLFAVLVAALLTDGRSLRRAVWAAIAGAGAIATVSVYQYVTGAFTSNFAGFGRATIESIVGTLDDYRLSGPFDDPNFFALALLLAIPLAADRALHEHSVLLRVGALAATLMCVLAVVFTFSRGGFIALLLVGALILIRERPGPVVVIAGSALLIALLALAPSQYTNRLRTITQALPGSSLAAPGSDESIRGRTSEIVVGLRMFSDHPLVGVGASNYEVNYQSEARRLGLDPRREDREAHDLYVEIGAEMGLVGLVAFGGFVMLTGARLRSVRRLADVDPDARQLAGAVGISLIAYLVASLFLHAAYTRPVWLLVGLAWAAPAVARATTDHVESATAELVPAAASQ